MLRGIFFGMGMGLITTAMNGLTNGYTSSAYLVGALLIVSTAGWTVLKKDHRA